MKTSLGGTFKNLQKGDAVVAFSRVALHALKASIEEETGRRCAIVYGSLPPETRAQQAALFNDPDNDYDYLVASDAIGMGLNLEIKRVVFESATKHDGIQFRTLSISELKQIGGRAGRFRTAAQEIKAATGPEGKPAAPVVEPAAGKSTAVGYVTSFEDDDLEVVQNAFEADAEPLKTAGILPPTFLIERFYSYFPPETPLSFVLLRLREMAKLSSRFSMCAYRDIVEVADSIQPFPMSIYDRCIFLTAPVSLRDVGQRDVLKALARCVSEMSGGHLLNIPEIRLEVLDATKENFEGGEANYLRHLEALHKSITLYLWLTYRYTGVFTSQGLAFHVKSIVEEKITAYLENLNMTEEKRQQRKRRIRKLAEKSRKTQESILNREGDDEDLHHEGPGVWNEEGHEEPLLEDPEEADDVTPGGIIPEAGREPGVSSHVNA
jgi:ATP-dependent RNA helicase SUPV3L1/SUV3